MMNPLKLRATHVMTIITVFIIFTGLPENAPAGNSWLEKGSSLLKSGGHSDTSASLTAREIGDGLKEALRVGSETVVKQLGARDGFYSDAAVHIPLPHSLNRVKSMLATVGKAGLLEDLELRLNRAAEAATPKAKQLFADAISRMSLDDVKAIYDGPDDAATRYFREKMSPALALEMKPVVENTLDQVGALQAYDRMIREYKQLPFVPDVKANLSDHVVNRGMDGIFYYLAKEEAAIRRNPVKQTTQLLKTFFGN